MADLPPFKALVDSAFEEHNPCNKTGCRICRALAVLKPAESLEKSDAPSDS